MFTLPREEEQVWLPCAAWCHLYGRLYLLPPAILTWGDSSPIPNRNGSRLLDDVRRYPLTRCWDIGILVVRPTPVEEVAWTTLYSPQDWWLHASSAPPSLCFFLAMLPLASATQFQLHPPSRYLPNTTQHTSPTWLLLCCFLHSTFTPLVYYIPRWWNQAIYI